MSQRVREKNGVAVLYVGWFLVDVDLVVVNPLLVPMSHQFQVGLGTVSLALTAYLLMFGIMQPIHGNISDGVGRVPSLRVGLAGMCAGNIVAAIAPNIGVLIAGRALAGAFASALAPITVAYVADRVPPERRQRALASLMSVAALGIATGIVSSAVIADLLSWRVAFGLVAAIAGVLVILYGSLPETLVKDPARPSMVQRVGRVFGIGWFRFLVVWALLEGAAMMGFYNFFNASLQVKGGSIALTGIVTAMYGLGAVGGGVVLRAIYARVTQTQIIGAALTLLFAAYVVAAMAQNFVTILLASVFAGIAFAVGQSALQTWMVEVSPPEVRGTASAVLSSAVFVSAAASTALVRGLATSGEFGRVFLIAAIVALPVAVIGTFGRAKFMRERQAAASAPALKSSR